MSFELTPIPVNDDVLDAVASGSFSPHSAGRPPRATVSPSESSRPGRRSTSSPTGAYAATRRGGIWAQPCPAKEITATACPSPTANTIVRDGPYRYLPTLVRWTPT